MWVSIPCVFTSFTSRPLWLTTSADELAMDPLVAEAVLEFADDLRTARAASGAWAETKGLVQQWGSGDSEDDA